MKRFPGIDGLRAWLAWTIVASHIFLFTAIDNRFPVLGKLDNAAHQAVLVFTIISGFVIAHLLIEKKEPYRVYIARRFLRIYPVYIICFAVGIFTTYLHLDTFLSHPFGPYMPEPDLLAHEFKALGEHGVSWYLITHLALIHGAISNHVLDQSQYMFLGIAWSLSLEWQFYLVAPLVLFFARRPWGKIAVSAVAVVLLFAYTAGIFGDFEALSFLPGAVLYFAAGIATRLVIHKIPRASAYPLAGVVLAIGFVHMTQLLVPFIVWAAFVAWMVLDRPADEPSLAAKKYLSLAFESAPVKYLGRLSYVTFLAHEPIIHFIGYVCVKQMGLGMYATTAVTLLTAPPLILLASMGLYKYVEAPVIAYGKRLFRQPPDALPNALEELTGLNAAEFGTDANSRFAAPALKAVNQK